VPVQLLMFVQVVPEEVLLLYVEEMVVEHNNFLMLVNAQIVK
jgi:hypothetical protein